MMYCIFENTSDDLEKAMEAFEHMEFDNLSSIHEQIGLIKFLKILAKFQRNYPLEDVEGLIEFYENKLELE